MANQWGRDGSTLAGSSGGGSGLMAVIFALFGLAFGGGSGYFAGKYFDQSNTAILAQKEDEISDLKSQLSSLKFDNQGSYEQTTELQSRLDTLQKTKQEDDETITSLRTKLESLRQWADDQKQGLSNDAKASAEALRKINDQLAEAHILNNKLQKSLKISELQIVDLEKETSENRLAIDRLDGELNRQEKLREDQISQYEKERKTLLQALADANKLVASKEKTLAETKAEIKRLLEIKENDQSGQTQVALLEQEINKLKNKLSKVSDSGADNAEKLVDAENQVAILKKENLELKSTLEAAEKKKEQLGSDIKGLEEKITLLEVSLKQVSEANNDIVGNEKPKNTEETVSENNLRDRVEVRRVIGNDPALASVSPAKLQILEDVLVSGVCVSDSLKKALGRVSAVALRNLIRELDSPC